MEVLEIIEKLNPWWAGRDFESGICRESYIKKVKDFIKTGEILILTGVRRSGKTTLLLQTVNYLLEKGVKPKQILFVNFDEADLATIKDPIQTILNAYYHGVCNDEEKAYFIFDEIQNVGGWERWAKTIYDHKFNQLILSGSSSHLLDNKLATLISGRYLKIKVFPLDLREYLNFMGLSQLKSRLDLAGNKNKIMRLLKEYLLNGGFPRVALQKEERLKREHLKIYYESIIYKDILLMHNVRNSKLMKELIYYLLSNFTGLYSYKGLSELLKIDFITIKEYLNYIEESRILFELPIFSYSLKVQSRNNKKIYCIDNGLRNSVSFKFSKDEGKLAENLVFVELQRKEKDIYYWKNKGEIDFVIKNRDNSLTAINVSYTNNINQREIESLLEFKSVFGKTKELILLTKDLEKQEKGIKFIPLWKWLLK
ncbi:MAG: ATP-binding protein [Candidatus Woesearchaeota archaeon]